MDYLLGKTKSDVREPGMLTRIRQLAERYIPGTRRGVALPFVLDSGINIMIYFQNTAVFRFLYLH